MAHEIIFKKRAEKQFEALPEKARKHIAKKIDELAARSTPNGCEKLEGCDGLWRLRWGQYRIVYAEPDGDGTIRILKVAHRRDAYR